MNEEISLWFLEEGNEQRVEEVLCCCEDDAAEVIMNLREDLLCALEDLKQIQDEFKIDIHHMFKE